MDARLIRSLLFVPGDRPDRFAKAESSGTDAVIFDLEDAVPPARKDGARTLVVRHLQTPAAGDTARVVRVNRDGVQDLEALAAAKPDFVLLPKVAEAAEVRAAHERLGTRAPKLIALIESARGLENAPAIATSSPAIAALAFGGADLAAELGAEMAWDTLVYARSRVVAAAALRRLAVFDMPFLDTRDRPGLQQECRAARRLGFTGKLAIHPDQVLAIAIAFSPTPEEVARARRVLEASRMAQGGVTTLDGQMIDAPVVTAAQRLIALAERSKA
jgi:(S)-citramalyl-CoA lyase